MIGELTVDQATLDEIAVTLDEYKLIVERLGRVPNEVELGMFGAMWSEHCGYKNSRPLLRLFPTTSPRVIQGPGENAGVVDVGDGLAIVMKIESHNHPSAVEPFQGAATGVGGIIRDIFTMGARPIAILDSLRFGNLDDARTRYLLDGVVAGIAHYGNSLGVPTVGGEVAFADAYQENPLVNAMAVGVIEADQVVNAQATGAGNLVLLVGADTGRDGIHGCSGLASRELSDTSDDQRPTVQVGNPFLEKLLIEACLELQQTGFIVGMQDLGAAGITSAVVEAASKGKSGVEIDVQRVARRATGMTPYEVMLSESQERMLVVVRPEHVAAVRAIFERWELHADVIGKVTDDGLVRVRDGDRTVAEVPAEILADAPAYRRAGRRPSWLDEPVPTIPPDGATLGEALLRVLRFPDVASKAPLFRRYDWSVQTNTLAGPGKSDAAVLRLKGTRKAIALATDGNGRYCYLDPYRGGAIALAEAARNVVCAGAEPIAATDCLNFGNPEKPDVYYQLEEAIRGMSEACRVLETPIVSGNVSLYNESNGRAIYPTPTVGMLGLLDDARHRTTAGFVAAGDRVVLLGDAGRGLGGSAYLASRGYVVGPAPTLDLETERRVQRLCLEAIRRGLVRSAHDVSDGGIGVTLAECCLFGKIGFAGPAPTTDDRFGWLFSEDQSRIVVSVQPADESTLLALADEAGVTRQILGVVGGERLVVDGWLDVALEELGKAWGTP
ncbi:MAG TPA: phosphoribosylformylglycinamidine synthase subunit PurL [Chloroflexota bacterium]|nr:phosphoribosylformylglycinamidine synthase subunit PurL [Chloroflexota bacterium]